MGERHPSGVSARAVLVRRARWGALLVAVAALLAFDWTRPPERQWTARAELSAIGLYRGALSPLVGRAGVRCRFAPTCSRYAEAVIRRDGAVAGTARALWRIARCMPWTPENTLDPP